MKSIRKRTERSRKIYDYMASEYDTSLEGISTIPHKEELVKRVQLSDGDNVLDVACGNGTLLGELMRKAKINAFGVDFSENMIAIAKARHPNGTFSISSCTPLTFEDESMDVITVSCAFHHFEEPRAFVNECMRVLKMGGIVYLAEPFFPPLVRWITNTMWVPFSKSGDVKIYNQQELRTIFKELGFRDIDFYIKDTVLFFTAKKLGLYEED